MNKISKGKNRRSIIQQQAGRLPAKVVCCGGLKRRGGFGLNEVIGIAAGVIIALVVVIPGLQGFAQTVVDQLTTWWTSLSTGIFT